MRFRFLLLAVVAACVAGGVFVGKADAIAFNDSGSCPVSPLNPTIFVCPTGETGKAYSLQVSARGGCDVYVWTNPGGGMPPGLSLGSSGLISGTPTTSGKFVFWLQIQDTPGNPFWCSDDKAAQRQFELDVLQGLQIVQRQSALTPGQVGVAYSQQFTATGGNPSWSLSAGSLPAGLSLNTSTGLLSGTPSATGDYSFKVTATDGSRTDTQSYGMSVVQALKITTPAPAPAEVARPFSLTLAATGGKSGYKWSTAQNSPLPAGLSLDTEKGTITGTPTAAGASTVQVTVTDALGLQTTTPIKIVVAAQLAQVKRPLRIARTGQRYRAQLFAAGGVAPKTWKVTRGKLPVGLRLSTATGLLTGTARKAGTSRVTIQVTDQLGATSTASYVLRVK